MMMATLLQATFTGEDRKLAQGAIERHDLFHREIEPRIWLIEVDEETPEEWAARLSHALPPRAGRFEVQLATPEQEEKVRKGEIKLQR